MRALLFFCLCFCPLYINAQVLSVIAISTEVDSFKVNNNILFVNHDSIEFERIGKKTYLKVKCKYLEQDSSLYAGIFIDKQHFCLERNFNDKSTFKLQFVDKVSAGFSGKELYVNLFYKTFSSIILFKNKGQYEEFLKIKNSP